MLTAEELISIGYTPYVDNQFRSSINIENMIDVTIWKDTQLIQISHIPTSIVLYNGVDYSFKELYHLCKGLKTTIHFTINSGVLKNGHHGC